MMNETSRATHPPLFFLAGAGGLAVVWLLGDGVAGTCGAARGAAFGATVVSDGLAVC